METNRKAYEGMGSILARLPFSSSLKNVYGGVISEEEHDALQHALQNAAFTLMTARQYYGLGWDELEACATGFAQELTRISVSSRVEHKRSVETMLVDGHKWELVFDPGPATDDLRTDEKGRVWRKCVNDDDVDAF